VRRLVIHRLYGRREELSFGTGTGRAERCGSHRWVSIADILAGKIAEPPARSRQARIPEAIEFQTKPEIALEQIRQALAQKVPAGVVLADAGYGNGNAFRAAITQLRLEYVTGIESSTTVWEPSLTGPPRSH
jgi:SRSO17 transposase